ncbi:hypothetical protein ACHAPJ_009466 [Fusarium lateritium]
MEGEDWLKRPDSNYPTHVRMNSRLEKRVVDLEPGLPNQELRCRLSTQSIWYDGPSDYDALSYAWGDWKDTKRIHLDGISDFPVTLNLYYALRRLRDAKNTRRLWIDQICMNQRCECTGENHICEPNIQVPLMGDIYKKARRVIVWLGDDDKHIISLGGNPVTNVFETLRMTFPPTPPNITKTRAPGSSSVPKWWTRAWVLQEVIMAQENPAVMLGEHRMEWDELLDLFDKKMKGIWVDWSVRYSQMRQYDILRYPTTDRNIYTLSLVLASSETRFPEDKIYCILSSLPEAERALITQPEFKPTVSEVFATATYASIATSGSLGILSLIPKSRTENTFGIPSWAVDFTFPQNKIPATKPTYIPQKGHRSRLWEKFSLPERISQPSSIYRLFNFAKFPKGWCQKHPQTIARARLDGGYHHKLVLTGLEFDGVHKVAELALPSGITASEVGFGIGYGENLSKLFLPLSGVASWYESKIMTDDEKQMKSSLQERLSQGNPYSRISRGFGCTSSMTPSTQDHWVVRISMIDYLWRRWDRSAKHRDAKDPDGLELLATVRRYYELRNQLLPGQTSYDIDGDELWEVHRHISLTSYFFDLETCKLVYFITETGFVGVGPPGLRSDDKIVLFYGSRIPIALRQLENGNWSYIGFVYVHGIMFEELWKFFPSIELEESEFILE